MAKQKENTERVNVFISPELKEELENEASSKGTNVSALIRMILMERRIQNSDCSTRQSKQSLPQ